MMWASSRFGHTHSQNPSRASPSHNGDAHIIRVLGMGIHLSLWQRPSHFVREKPWRRGCLSLRIPLGWAVSITLTWGRGREAGRGWVGVGLVCCFLLTKTWNRKCNKRTMDPNPQTSNWCFTDTHWGHGQCLVYQEMSQKEHKWNVMSWAWNLNLLLVNSY